MKTVIAFIILCCYSQDKDGTYKYEAVSLTDTTNVGSLYTKVKHSPGDTVFLSGEVKRSKPN